MSDKENPTPSRGVPVELDRVRYLRFPLSVLRNLEKRGEGSDQSIGTVFYLGLKGDDPDLTVEQVEDMIDLEMLPRLKDALKKATAGLVDLSSMFPDAFPGEKKDPPTVAADVEMSSTPQQP